MRDASRHMRDARRQVRKLTGGFGRLGAVLSVGAFVGMTRQALMVGDALAKTADKLGLTTEALAGLQFAAKLAGIQTRTFDMGLQRMVRRIAEAAIGTGEAKDALRQLGIDVKRVAKLDADQQFLAIVRAMQSVENQSERVRLAFKLFDSEGVALVNLLNKGEGAIQAAQRQAQLLGVTLSRADASAIERVNDAFTRAKTAVMGMWQTLTIRLAPTLERVADLIAGTAIIIRQALTPEVVNVSLKILKWTAAVAGLLFLFPKLVTAIKILMSVKKAYQKVLQGVATAQAFVMALTPGGFVQLAIAIGAATAAVAGMGVMFHKLGQSAQAAIDEVKRLGGELDENSDSVNDIADAMDRVADATARATKMFRQVNLRRIVLPTGPVASDRTGRALGRDHFATSSSAPMVATPFVRPGGGMEKTNQLLEGLNNEVRRRPLPGDFLIDFR